jgi:hypothetical protein
MINSLPIKQNLGLIFSALNKIEKKLLLKIGRKKAKQSRE